MSEESEPKIIVDDDWKEQVQREKEQLEQNDEEPAPGQQLPDASFGFIVTSCATQALSAMGFVPNPLTGKAEPDKALAKHLIDSLGILQEKTAGNLTDEEGELLNETVHQLRMAYVSVENAPVAGGSNDQPSSPTIELP